jgi:type I restriction enzyme M protein
MAIYLLFIQHILYSLSDTGKAAIVVPTWFLTTQSGIEKAIREKVVDKNWLKWVVSMPSNIFATTWTNVSVIFIDKTRKEGDEIMLLDASKLWETIKEGKNQKTYLRDNEQQQIIDTFKNMDVIEDFSVKVTNEQIKEKNYSWSAWQYFEIKIDHIDISADEFESRMFNYKENLKKYFQEGKDLENEIFNQLNMLKYGD